MASVLSLHSPETHFKCLSLLGQLKKENSELIKIVNLVLVCENHPKNMIVANYIVVRIRYL